MKNKKENWEKTANIANKYGKDGCISPLKKAIDQLLKSEKRKWEVEQIMAIDKKVLEHLKREQGTDEFYETIVKPIEKRAREKLLRPIEKRLIEFEDQLPIRFLAEIYKDLEEIKKDYEKQKTKTSDRSR